MAIIKDNKRNKYYISYKAKDESGIFKTHNIRNKDWNITGPNKVTLTFMKEIELSEIEKKREKEKNYTTDGNKLHLNQLCEMFYKVMRSDGIDKSTIDGYRACFKYYLFSIVPPETLINNAFKIQNIDKIKINLANSNLKENTVNNKIAIIKKLIVFARKRKIITREVSDDAEDLLVRVKEVRNEETHNFFQHGDEDLRKFENSFNEVDQEWYIPIMTMFYGALRIGEWQALTINDVDFENSTLLINKQVDNNGNLKNKTKGREVRIVRLPRPFIAKLKNFADNKKGNEEPLFASKKGKYICRNTVRNIINKHCELAGIPHLTPHGLRHSFATRMFNKGYDVKEVQEQLGHASMETTMQYYIHYTKNKDKDIDDLM